MKTYKQFMDESEQLDEGIINWIARLATKFKKFDTPENRKLRDDAKKHLDKLDDKSREQAYKYMTDILKNNGGLMAKIGATGAVYQFLWAD